MTVRVAIIDSGLEGPVLARRNFTEASASLGHGAALGRLVAFHAPETQLVDARIFGDSLLTDAETAAGAIDWAISAGAHILNLSFGLPRNHPDLEASVKEAVATGVLVVAAAPARGGPVYPAALPGVIRASGDARCDITDFSWINDDRVTIGACPRGPDNLPGQAGASFATARVSGALARVMAETGLRGPDLLAAFAKTCQFHGRERR